VKAKPALPCRLRADPHDHEVDMTVTPELWLIRKYSTATRPALHSLNVQLSQCAERGRVINPMGRLDRIVLQSQSTLPYYHNYSPGTSAATLAVVVVHGIKRNADDYFRSIVRAAVDLDVTQRALVIAPCFQIEGDTRKASDAYWTDSGPSSWKDGGDAVKPAGLSSFQVMDKILTTLADKHQFPQLARVALVGHSAGGQFIHRYAACGRAPKTSPGMPVSYVTANPSSYLYLSPHRPVEKANFDYVHSITTTNTD